MKIGAHVSAAGGLHKAPENAAELGLECFQFFSRPPQGGAAKPLTEKDIGLFRRACDVAGFVESYIHTPYVLNLASDRAEVRHRTVGIIRNDLERASSLGVTAVMTHLGSASKIGDEKLGVKYVVEGLKKILDGYTGISEPLIEMSAGAGMVIGDSFEEIADILSRVDDDRLGICFDTAHAFASGYDLHSADNVARVLEKFDQIVGIERLRLIHANDSKSELGSHKDRHEHIGFGLIGLDGFKAIVSHPKLSDINLILETPDGSMRKNDISTLINLRNERFGLV